MSKASIDTGAAAQAVHTRTTSDGVESQAVVLVIDGSDSVVPAHATDGLGVEVKKSVAVALAAGSALVGKVGHDTTGIGSGRKVVTTAATRVALASTTAAKWATITAETDNTGLVVVGSAAGVIAALATREGVPLAAGDSITVPCDDLADIGLDATVSGDGVTFAYGT